VDPIDAVGRLPDAYAKALLLEREGLEAVEIALRLGIEPESVASLLELAHRKLALLTDGTPTPDDPTQR
jgi:DNA-directed RNA polymerase specialized sigma24 family protein